MGFLSRFENKMEDALEGAADRVGQSPISPVQIAKKAEKQMQREKMVGAGKQYAPTLYTVLVNPDDDRRLFGYYPTLAGEIETYLAAKAIERGLIMDGQPLVRFIVDDVLKRGKFEIIAETVAAPIIAQLRDEEMKRYGISEVRNAAPYSQPVNFTPAPANDYIPTNQPLEMPADCNTVVFEETSQPQVNQSNEHYARLVNLSSNRAIDLAGDKLLIGRESKNDIAVADINASRIHAELTFDPQNGWVISDLGSTNGTFVNGSAITSCKLAEGDQITIGMTDFMFTQA